MEGLALVAGMVAILVLAMWVSLRSARRVGELEAEQKELTKGQRVKAAADRVMAQPVLSGRRLRERMQSWAGNRPT